MSVLIFVLFAILVFLVILLLIGIYQKNTNEICRSKKHLNGRTVIVTGGTAGMGLEMAKDFAQRGARVIIACPFQNEGVEALQEIIHCSNNDDVTFKLLDLASFESTRNFAADILKTEDRLDILINNAAVIGPVTGVSCDGLNFVMQVNYYGAFLLTILLVPLLKKTGRLGEPSRIVNVSSASYILGRTYLEYSILCRYSSWLYFNSKLYIVMFTRELAKRLKNTNVVVNSADPGGVGTNIFYTHSNFPTFFTLVKFFFWVLFKHPWQGAQTAIHVSLDREAGEVSGEYFKNCKQVRTSNIACDEESAANVWKKSVLRVGLTDKELGQYFFRE